MKTGGPFHTCVGLTRYHTQTNGDINVKSKSPSYRKTRGPFHTCFWYKRDQKQRIKLLDTIRLLDNISLLQSNNHPILQTRDERGKRIPTGEHADHIIQSGRMSEAIT